MYSYTQIETQGAEHVRAADQWLKNERLLHKANLSPLSFKGVFAKALARLIPFRTVVTETSPAASNNSHTLVENSP